LSAERGEAASAAKTGWAEAAAKVEDLERAKVSIAHGLLGATRLRICVFNNPAPRHIDSSCFVLARVA